MHGLAAAKSLALAAATTLGWLFAACGIDTYSLDPGSIDAQELTSWEGAVVELSSNQELEGMEPPSVLAGVGGRIEFPSNRVAAVCAPTNQLARSRLAVDLDGSRVIFEFSSALERGVFTDGSARLEIRSLSHTPDIENAVIDRSVTNTDINESRVGFDSHSVTVDFDGMAFDPSTRVGIDLVFANAHDGG